MGTTPADCSCGGGAGSSTTVPILLSDGSGGTEGTSGRGSGSAVSSGFASAGLESDGAGETGGVGSGNKNSFPATNSTTK